MTKLSLWFSSQATPELTRVKFVSSATGEITSIRGKSSGAYSDCGSFQWTGAVQALTLFFLRAAGGRGESRDVVLEGDVGSPAASLDYAISKQPQWLLEMFGSDSRGDSLIRTLILRSNPNLKRKGPVSLSLNERRLAPAAVAIYIDGIKLIDELKVEQLANDIEDRLQSSPRGTTAKKPEDYAWDRIVRLELSSMLRATNIFNRRAISSTIDRLSKNPSFTKLAGSKSLVLSDFDYNASAAARVGLTNEERELEASFLHSSPIRFAVPISAAGTIGILNYLKHFKNYPIEISHEFPHTLEIRRRIMEKDFLQPPDACVLGSAPAATLLRSRLKAEYVPFMLMPPGSQEIVESPQSKASPGSGTYLYMKEEPSTSSFYFDELLRQRQIDKQRISTAHLEPNEAFTALSEAESDYRAILFYPYAGLFKALGVCSSAAPLPNNFQMSDMILFVRKQLLADKKRAQFLNIAIRNAWLTLLEESQTFEQVVQLTAHSLEYKKSVRRCTGLYDFAKIAGRVEGLRTTPSYRP